MLHCVCVCVCVCVCGSGLQHHACTYVCVKDTVGLGSGPICTTYQSATKAVITEINILPVC